MKSSGILTILLAISFTPVFAQTEPVSQFPQIADIPTVIIESTQPFYQPTQDALTSLFTSGTESGVAILGALILLLIGYLVGLGIEKAIRFFIKKILDNKFMKEKLDVDKEKMKDEGWYHVTNLIPATIKWFVWIFFFVTAIDLLGFTQASETLSILWVYIPNIIAFVIIIAVGTIVITYIMKWAESRTDIFGQKGEVTLQKTLVKAILYTIIFSIGITQLGVGEDVIPIIIWVVLGGIMATIVVCVGVGLKDLVPQFVINRTLSDLGVKKGAKIQLTDKEKDSEVLEIGLTHTKLKQKDKTIIIPNSSWQDYSFDLKVEVKEDEKD